MKCYNLYKYSDKWTKIGVNLRICLCNNQNNFHLHRFTTSENIAKSFRGDYFFDSHCILMTHAYSRDFCMLPICGN